MPNPHRHVHHGALPTQTSGSAARSKSTSMNSWLSCACGAPRTCARAHAQSACHCSTYLRNISRFYLGHWARHASVRVSVHVPSKQQRHATNAGRERMLPARTCDAGKEGRRQHVHVEYCCGHTRGLKEPNVDTNVRTRSRHLHTTRVVKPGDGEELVFVPTSRQQRPRHARQSRCEHSFIHARCLTLTFGWTRARNQSMAVCGTATPSTSATGRADVNFLNHD